MILTTADLIKYISFHLIHFFNPHFFPAQADVEMVKKLEARGFSVSDVDPREKPSSVMQSMEETLDSLTDGVEA